MRAMMFAPLLLVLPEPVAGQSFTDVAGQAGVTFGGFNTSASSWRDYDGDGDEDLFLPINGGSFQPNDILAQNDGNGQFVDVAASAGVQGHAILSFQLSAAWADYDNDGDADLFVTNDPEPYQLFRNDGSGNFTDVAVSAGLTGGSFGGTSAVWADVDNDGWLDVLVTTWGAPNRLFHSNGNGTFTDIAASAGVAHGVAASPGGVFADYDGDGDLDLYSCSVDSSDPGRLLRNEGNLTFVDVSATAGLAPIRASAAIWADLDGDGDFDLYICEATTGTLTGRHYLNQGDGSFADAGTSSGLRFSLASGVVTRGASVADYDNDGWLDVYVPCSNTSTGGNPATNLLFHNDGTGHFTEMGSAAGVADTQLAGGSSWADYDDDGDLDLFVANDWPQDCLLYRNNTTGAHWTRLRLTGTNSNRDAVGARIRLLSGGMWQTRQIDGGGSAKNCQDSLPVEFGLGSATSIDMLEIFWPSGAHDVFTSLAVDLEHVLVEGAGTGCPPPTNYCLSVPNSAGTNALITWTGTTSVTSNDLVLRVDSATPGRFGLFYYGMAQTQVPFNDGWMCVAGGGLGLFRLNPALLTDNTGSLVRPLDFTTHPMNNGNSRVDPGERWNFQFWYRDPGGPGGTGGNTSDALSVMFCL